MRFATEAVGKCHGRGKTLFNFTGGLIVCDNVWKHVISCCNVFLNEASWFVLEVCAWHSESVWISVMVVQVKLNWKEMA